MSMSKKNVVFGVITGALLLVSVVQVTEKVLWDLKIYPHILVQRPVDVLYSVENDPKPFVISEGDGQLLCHKSSSGDKWETYQSGDDYFLRCGPWRVKSVVWSTQPSPSDEMTKTLVARSLVNMIDSYYPSRIDMQRQVHITDVNLDQEKHTIIVNYFVKTMTDSGRPYIERLKNKFCYEYSDAGFSMRFCD